MNMENTDSNEALSSLFSWHGCSHFLYLHCSRDLYFGCYIFSLYDNMSRREKRFDFIQNISILRPTNAVRSIEKFLHWNFVSSSFLEEIFLTIFLNPLLWICLNLTLWKELSGHWLYQHSDWVAVMEMGKMFYDKQIVLHEIRFYQNS